MKAKERSISLLTCILLFSSACGTLEVGIEGTATPSQVAVATEDAYIFTPTPQATKTPVEVQPDTTFQFTSFVHPHWEYKLAIPNGAQVIESPDGLSTLFHYQDSRLIRGTYTLEVKVVPDPGTDSPGELALQMADGTEDVSTPRTVEVDGGRLIGAAVSSLLPQGGAWCSQMRVLDVAFIVADQGYVLSLRSDAPDRCDVETAPETELVVESFRVTSTMASLEMTLTATPLVAEQAPTPTAMPAPPELRVAFVKDDNVWLWVEGSVLSPAQEAIPLTNAGGASGVKISDDGEIVAFVRDDELWTVNSDGTEECQLVSASDLAAMKPRESFEFEIALNRFDWIPSTHTLAFNTRLRTEIGLVLNDDVRLVDADTGEQTLLLPPGDGGEFYYSPDGRQVAIVTAGSISLLDADGGNRRDIFTYTPVATYSEFKYYAQPAWAADSSSLRVAIPPANPYARPSQPTTVWYIPTDRSSSSLINNITAESRGQFAFSPDFNYVAYLALPEGALPGEQASLLITDLNSDETTIYYSQAHNLYGWAPDSRHFAFLANSQLPQAQLGQLGGDAIPAHDDAEAVVIDVSWVDVHRYLYLAKSPQGWDIFLGEIGGSSTLLAATAGQPPAYDFIAPATSVEK